ncbi:hypothetical protein N0V94_005689 [Neodidymelliopsis sp. IMI 364377]|nr:hypothetical protein N0V94_005689 [Neodidymelliopsis sp. IMI 364377]
MSANKRLKLSSMAPSKQSTGSTIIRFYDPDVQAKDTLGRTQEQILAWNDSQLEHSHNYIQMLFPLPEGSPFNFAAPVIDLETMKAFRERSELRQRLRRSFERMLTFYGFTTSIQPEVASKQEDDSIKPSDQKQVITKSKSTTTTAQPDEDGVQKTSAALEQDTTTSSPTEGLPEETKPSKSDKTSQSLPFDYSVSRGPNWRKASRNWCVRFDHNHLRITRILRCLRVLGLQTECDAFYAALKSVHDDPSISISDRTMMYWTRAVRRPLYLAPDDEEIEWLREWEVQEEARK